MTGHIAPATMADALDLAPRLRAADRAEMQAFTGMPPEIGLPLSLTGGGPTWTIRWDPSGHPLAIFGVGPVPHHPQLGIVWMVGSDELFSRPMTFLRQSRLALDGLHQFHPLLGNYVDARNTVHIRWLQWLGFGFLKLHPEFGVEKRPFIQFARLKTDV